MDGSSRGVFQVSLRETVEGTEKNRGHVCVHVYLCWVLTTGISKSASYLKNKVHSTDFSGRFCIF